MVFEHTCSWCIMVKRVWILCFVYCTFKWMVLFARSGQCCCFLHHSPRTFAGFIYSKLSGKHPKPCRKTLSFSPSKRPYSSFSYKDTTIGSFRPLSIIVVFDKGVPSSKYDSSRLTQNARPVWSKLQHSGLTAAILKFAKKKNIYFGTSELSHTVRCAVISRWLQ